ncbi:TetR/AcrR family transcriptional regulator [Mycolicibacterium vinylchloridicum]|jgi:AcrR family transcriptional regulator|uniref:TetR/AcrR family transcriptional regulator n=1 Tax=Mycolicibacterium vinylchloridicum TaxID=2736928 RepID=UPI0015C9BEF0|nr:TetR/AcrR family transcriptional regulator C-terminal domain-containing protein [Mycolicibacterium vinylchloridicum]
MRPRFTIGEIQTAALQIVDRDGLSGLSMRTLAAALGTGAMTLYNYVRDRDQLEELVAEAVIAGVELPETGGDWLSDVRAVATAMWHSVRAHPNAIPLVLTRRTVSPTSYAAAEGLVGALSRGGLEGAALLGAFRAVLSLVMGSAQVELAGPLAGAGRDEHQRQVAAQIGALAADRHHRLAALAEVSQRSSAAADFEHGLDLLLVGIRASAQALSTSPGHGPAVG